ncbi:DUF2092 domain-containing protein [sulfur-oxidizing endosymbiont of Gigantopelta aegis]|uniref:DUF2092 domain-containing protein n=1 Tax=sulfur-oxidizing endosymbiont of Gigantopelta aegis TaxID=2794934 RepID=UPI0018DC5A32|nr:DUF2092 domain-containing protein [sulfur-oxidizing endosymbiont of Gigantopelta aegis]
MSLRTKLSHYAGVVSLSFCASLLTTSVVQSAEEVEAQADSLLKNMSTYIAGLQQFTVSSHSTIESMLDSGQKIMLDHDNETSVSRPNKLFSTRMGDAVEQKFYYDGKQFTLYSKAHNYYASVAAADNLTAALDQAINQFDLTAPGADLLYKDSYTRLSKGLISGFYVGKSMIDGVECHHLAFRNAEVDWQIWIQTGDKPLPKRYVVSSRWITGSPQFSLTMNWNTKPDLADKTFQFIVPEKAEKIDLLLRGTGQ